MKIGIPRALLYPIFYPMWETFFKELGHSIVNSTRTNKRILDSGAKACVEDACLPVKIMHGHVIDLIDRCDAVFIPRLISISQEEYICPKFIGIPEMIKNSVKPCPSLIVLDYNAKKSTYMAYKGYYKLASDLGSSKKDIKQALERALGQQRAYERALLGGSNPLLALEGLETFSIRKEIKGTIGLIGHPYLIYDRYISMDVYKKLISHDYRVIVPENIRPEAIEKACSIYPKKLFWSYGKHLLGSGLYMLEQGLVDGLVLVTSFACGIDSFVLELLQRKNNRDYKKPFTIITIDEHSGHAGFDTRLEAFIDMMEWRKENGNNISSHGKGLYIS